MKSPSSWTPLIISIAVTPILVYLAVASAGAGHGSYLAAIILFPYTMLSALAFGSITVPFMALAILQFPIYGLIVGRGIQKRSSRGTIIGLFTAHALATALFYAIGSHTF